MPHRRRTWIALALFVGVCLAVGAVGSTFNTSTAKSWYAALRKPAGTPPDWVFAPVWNTLYLLMGVAAWLVWRRAGSRGAAVPLFLFGVQLALNLAWSWIFFGTRSPGGALLEIVVLWAAILATMVAFWRVHRVAGLLLVPYLLWVGYAIVLNYGIWRLNPGA